MYGGSGFIVHGEYRLKECVLLFVKYPHEGKVKTRMVPFLTKKQASGLHRAMAGQTARMLERSGIDFFVCFYPANSKSGFVRWLGSRLKYMPQRGRGLGAKMRNAFRDVFSAGYERVIIIGSDIPGITGKLLLSAFKILAKTGAVIGPAKDGGYYLIGFKKDKFRPEAFDGILWGSASVLADTVKVLGKKFKTIGFAPELRDLDTPQDLLELRGRIKSVIGRYDLFATGSK